MTSPATLLTPREGRTQTDILGELARVQFAEGEQIRQSELVDRLPHSKGAISNNVRKIADTGLIFKEKRRYYRIDEAKLLTLYREHVDTYLARESGSSPFAVEVDAVNEHRTETKRDLPKLFEDNDILISVILNAFIDSTEVSFLRTVPDVCNHADELIQHVAARVVTSESFEMEANTDSNIDTLFRLAVVLDRTRDSIGRLSDYEESIAKYMPGNPPTQQMLTTITGGEKK